MKKCKTCEESLPLTSFYKHKTGKDGFRNHCKSCVLSSQRENTDPEKAKEAKQRYYERNKQVAIARSAKWREDNREKYNEWNRINRNKLRARGYALKRKYGISLEQYDELLEKQNGCCAICERHHAEFKIPLAVDHSHKTARIRGLLCTSCNYRLVARHEDGNLLRKIAEYIEQGTEWFVPDKPKKKRKKPSKRNS